MNWENNVRKVVPYVPGEQPKKLNMVKLNTNECPYPPAPGVEKLLKEMDYSESRLYPDPEIKELTSQLASYYGVKKEQVFVGVGSDDVLAMAFLTFFNSKDPILFPDITYAFYDVWADLYKIPYKTCPLKEDWHIDPKDYEQKNGGVVIANPNAPTGLEESQQVIDHILQANQDVVVIVDEAYVDFGGTSALPLVDKYENLLVVQTFSKSRSMAGARLGFGIGNPELIRDLNAVRNSTNPYNVNLLTSAAGVACLQHDEYNMKNCETIMETREHYGRKLRELGFEMPDSRTNFFFARHPEIPGEELYLALKKRGILVRHFTLERIRDYNRITVGTPEQMEKLIGTIKQILEERVS